MVTCDATVGIGARESEVQVTFGIPECPGSLRMPSASFKSLISAGADFCGEE